MPEPCSTPSCDESRFRLRRAPRIHASKRCSQAPRGICHGQAPCVGASRHNTLDTYQHFEESGSVLVCLSLPSRHRPYHTSNVQAVGRQSAVYVSLMSYMMRFVFPPELAGSTLLRPNSPLTIFKRCLPQETMLPGRTRFIHDLTGLEQRLDLNTLSNDRT